MIAELYNAYAKYVIVQPNRNVILIKRKGLTHLYLTDF